MPAPTPRCDTCEFWQAHPAGDDHLPHNGQAHGECRRYCPQPRYRLQKNEEPMLLGWGVTHADDWCGEYKQKGGA